ncbi:MAG: s-methyl-5-thioribose-1-phosphate isomerase [Spirochaetia bacterium]
MNTSPASPDAPADEGLPFIQRLSNVARYEGGRVVILDRRVYPASVEFVTCADYGAVARAIGEMVTQSYGPWVAASYGMVSAARSAQAMSHTDAQAELRRAAEVLSHARPTTSGGMTRSINRIRDFALGKLAEDREHLEAATLAFVESTLQARYREDRAICSHAVDLLPDPATILTQCYAETLIGFVLLISQERGKEISLICPETRPYLQGARLTAAAAHDLGIPTTVITDNMPAYVLSKGTIDAFVCAADVVTLDGHAVNKVGTFQIALAAHYHKVPFYVVRNPSAANPTIATVEIEERDPEESLHAMGVRTAPRGVSGYYPAFDITPPHLISAVCTSRGVFSPYDLRKGFGPDVQAH